MFLLLSFCIKFKFEYAGFWGKEKTRKPTNRVLHYGIKVVAIFNKLKYLDAVIFVHEEKNSNNKNKWIKLKIKKSKGIFATKNKVTFQ